ncbi:MAG TPA: hypothetical protein GXX36_02665 [Clostridiaceae bacterium]|nr:hypothetical protein [Clostridiaceae bacterium]
MKKRVISLSLAAIMLICMLPTATYAENTSESEPMYLGTEAEYQTAFDTIFDENGLYKVQVGFNSKDGVLNGKFGLVNKYGNFVAQPIYDEIELYADYDAIPEKGNSTVLPIYFIGGYTQAIRDGKMGLLNTRGEEVVPCQYDFVGLPSEGMCRVLNQVPGKEDLWYLGYWSIEQNKEVVKPGKYITKEKNTIIGVAPLDSNDYKRKKAGGDYLAVNDFIEGHALVFTEKAEPVLQSYKATIIDKNGKDVLGKSYFIYDYGNTYETYVQKGPYLVFHEPIKIKDRTFTKINDSSWKMTETFETYATGFAGPSGVLIKPTYTSGINASPGEAFFYIDPAVFQINTKTKTILASNNMRPDKLYGTGYGVIDFNGKTVIPFEQGELYYNEKENAYSGREGRLYTSKYNKLDYDNSAVSFVNGYITAMKYGAYNTKESYTPTTYYYVKADGSSLNLTQKFGWSLKDGYEMSDFSTTGYAWIPNKDRTKWGLIDFSGKAILPFQYDKVDYTFWTNEKNGFTVVEQNGKMGLVNAQGKLVIPCSYKSVSTAGGKADVVLTVFVENDSGKSGIADFITGKILVPIAYDSFGAFRSNGQIVNTYFEMGVYYAKKDGKTYLVDKNGKEVFSTTLSFNEATNGLYSFKDGLCDNRGRLIFPDNLRRNTNLEINSSFTIYVKDGKVYRASANYLKSTYGYKTYVPEKVTATPSSTRLVVNGRNVAVDAYAIGGNNYIKLRDLATMVNNTEKNFEVTWDGSKNAINLISNKAYTSVGGEMVIGDGKAKTASRTNSRIFVDGGEVSMAAYTIDGNNYFKLRDVMQIFDIGVGWDGATGTATINTGESYALTAYEQSKYEAHQKAYQEAIKNPYQPMQQYKEPFIQFQTTPAKRLYKVGEPFEIGGLKVVDVDIYGDGVDISNDIELRMNNTKIYDGYIFKEAGEKTVDCYYEGEKLNSFRVFVVPDNDSILESGNYYLQINGMYIYPVYAGGYWLELYDTKPENPFTIELVSFSDEKGPQYTISYNGNFFVQYGGSKDGQQLRSGSEYPWRIDKYSTYCTIRDYITQKLMVVTSGAKYDNKTKIIVWTHTDSVPEHAKITFIKAD